MRVSRFVSGFVSIVAGFAAGCLFAIAAPQVIAQGTFASALSAGPVEGTSRPPYTTTSTEKQVQTLGNGTTVTRESTTKFARDSSGRSYIETHHALPAGSNEQPQEIVTYHIFDPAARTTTTWNSNTKEAKVTHRAETQTLPARIAEAQTAATGVQTEPVTRQRADVQHEDLGTKSIAGVNAKGTRVTRVIPAGRDGNDQSITTTMETWRSTEYRIVLMSIIEDPRYGTTTREVTEFTPGEPDAALFRVPEGYSVREVSARTVANQ